MIAPDTQILSVIQIALIGILVVIGLFLLWRKIHRLEEKIQILLSASSTADVTPCFMPRCHDDDHNHEHNHSNEREDEHEDIHAQAHEAQQSHEKMMNEIFEETFQSDPSGAFMVFSPYAQPTTTVRNVTEEPKIESIPHMEVDHESEAPTEKGIGKTKFIRMNVEGLRDILMNHGLSPEGTKNKLIDRILENKAIIKLDSDA